MNLFSKQLFSATNEAKTEKPKRKKKMAMMLLLTKTTTKEKKMKKKTINLHVHYLKQLLNTKQKEQRLIHQLLYKVTHQPVKNMK